MPRRNVVEEQFNEALYEQAERLIKKNSDDLVGMALLAHENRRSKPALRQLSQHFGRSARSMVNAVARYPNWFLGVDDAPRIAAEPDELLALFAMCLLPKPECEKVYAQWRSKTLRAWQVIELVQETKHMRTKRQQIRLRKAVLENVDDDEGKATLLWRDEIKMKHKWEGKKISLLVQRIQEV